MRDRLIHDYLGIDYDIVWDVVENKIPSLCKQIQEILLREGCDDWYDVSNPSIPKTAPDSLSSIGFTESKNLYICSTFQRARIPGTP